VRLRSRSALIATALAGLCIAGCGSDGHAAHDARTTVRQPGGTRLIFAAQPPVDAAALSETIAVMRARLRGLGVDGAAVTAAGGRIEVTIPDSRNARAAQQQVGTPGRLALYDWETNVVGPDDRTAPDNAAVTGGQSAGTPGSGAAQSRYDALAQASRLPPRAGSASAATAAWYGVDARARAVLCGPASTKATAREACTNAGKRPTSYLQVPAGYVVVQAESDADDPKTVAAASDSYYILRDRPALTGADITDPEQETDQTTSEPTVVFDFTSAGRRKWQKLTRTIAERGTSALLPGVDPQQVANHFAIALDTKLISVPYIDPRENPHGIDGANGSQISGGFTLASARNLTNLLKTGALPLHLDLISTRTFK
jgi:SecD/SecF fusion protein